MIHPEFKKFVNLIGHDITISGHATLPRIPIAETHFEKIVNLPDSEDGVYYIVSRIVMDFVPFDREDVFSVDTGPTAIRDQSGQVVAVTQLSL